MPLFGSDRGRLRVAIVGPCAAGKTTLADGLQRLGFGAYVCGQEHSEIPTLWQHGDPHAVIFLDVDLATIRRRRGADWPSSLFETQLLRLKRARAAALVVIDARMIPPDEVIARAVAALESADLRR